ncbi:MAG TPA: arsenate reductase family protein [Oculatellaceae cyanobacterium]
MSEKIIVYEKPTCTKCREVNKLLKEKGVDFEKINYYDHPISEKKLRELVAKMKISPKDMIRKTESIYKKLQLSKGSPTDDDLIKLMAKYPDLMQRPIIEKGTKAVLGRPVENVEELL